MSYDTGGRKYVRPVEGRRFADRAGRVVSAPGWVADTGSVRRGLARGAIREDRAEGERLLSGRPADQPAQPQPAAQRTPPPAPSHSPARESARREGGRERYRP